MPIWNAMGMYLINPLFPLSELICISWMWQRRWNDKSSPGKLLYCFNERGEQGGKGSKQRTVLILYEWAAHAVQLKLLPLPHYVFSGKDADNRFSGGDLSEEVYTCLPCREGCSNCKDDTPCYAQEDKYLRLAIISFQTLCMLLDFISMLVVYHFRKAKVSSLVLL